eukprot:m.127213 g.127213  ORF g.127213 m.127213 type:complete len:66 (-) comp15650_c1_seq1:210-407(-)
MSVLSCADDTLGVSVERRQVHVKDRSVKTTGWLYMRVRRLERNKTRTSTRRMSQGRGEYKRVALH